MIELIGLAAVMMIAPVAIAVTLVYSYEATKGIGNDKDIHS